MSIELEDDPQLRSDLSEAERVAADKLHDEAFAAAFDKDEEQTAASPAPAPVPTESTARTPIPAPAPAPVDADDPFAGFSPKARELFAKIPELENDNRSLRGRVPVLQRENEDFKRRNQDLERRLKALEDQPPAARAAPAELTALERVRGELPEVADAIEEATRGLRQAAAAPPPPPEPKTPVNDDHEDDEARILGATHADWAPTMNSTDFKLWVATQPDEYSRAVMTSTKAAPVVEAITKFKAHQATARDRVTAAQTEAARRNKRASRGVTPSGNAAPLTPEGQTEHEAMLAAFHANG